MWPPEVTHAQVIIYDVTHRTVFTEATMATATGEVTARLIYGLMLKNSVCGGSRQICERVMLKRRKRRKKMNTLMMSLCGALAVCCSRITSLTVQQTNRIQVTFSCGVNVAIVILCSYRSNIYCKFFY